LPPPPLACTRHTGAGVCLAQAHHRSPARACGFAGELQGIDAARRPPAWVTQRQLPVRTRCHANRLKGLDGARLKGPAAGRCRGSTTPSLAGVARWLSQGLTGNEIPILIQVEV